MNTLRHIFSQLVPDPVPDVPITGLCADTRLLQRGEVFFALEGVKTDGNLFLAEAVKGGASALVCEKPPQRDLGVPVFVVRNAQEVLALAAARLHQHPSKNFYLCGVTGTNGKTTTTYLLEKIWGERACAVMGTVNFRCAGLAGPATHTTPDALKTQEFFAQAAKTVKRVAIEVSSHALEQRRVWGCHFDTAVFTNLTQDHLDYHGDMSNYFDAKRLLFTSCLTQSEKGDKLAIINSDDDFGKALVAELQGLSVCCQTFSLKAKATLMLREVSFSMAGTEATLSDVNTTWRLKTNLLGEHNMKNILAALLVARHSGVAIADALACLTTVRVPGRLERVGETQFFVDYAHTPDALENVLAAVRLVMRAGSKKIPARLITVFGCGGDRDRTKRPLMGAVAARLSDVVIVTSDNPRTEDARKIIDDIVPGVERHMRPFLDKIGFVIEIDRKSALEEVFRLAGPEDVVVVAGKGHEDYQILGTTKVPFSDVEVLRGILQKREDTSKNYVRDEKSQSEPSRGR